MEEMISLNGVEQENQIWHSFESFLKEKISASSLLYGFGHSIFTAKRIGITRTIFVRHTHPEVAISALGTDSFLDHSIYAKAIIDSAEPFFWHLARQVPNLSEQQNRQLEINARNGLNIGVSLSLPFDRGRGFGGLGICCLGLSENEFFALWNKNKEIILERAQSFHQTMLPVMVRNRLKLTMREKEVLQYSAGGLSAKEISGQLGIETKTVYNTLERARKSMRATTTLEAVAKAQSYDLI